MTQQKANSINREYYIALAALTHELTGEEASDILSYLNKFGVNGFFARIDASDLSGKAKNNLNDLHQYLRSFEEVFGHDRS